MLGKSSRPHLLVLLLLSFSALFASFSNAYPLSTQNRWIIDDATGQRAKLVCANWAGHLQLMIPEGLDKQPLKDIVGQVVKNNFNCVRLTYAIYMWTRYGDKENLALSLFKLDLPKVMDGIAKYNPEVLAMTPIQVFEHVIKELGAQKVMVLLDNHVSEPKWCCDDDDENGFFGDRHFDAGEWIDGLTSAAQHFKGNPAVVAMSLRNELHGPRQNEGDWYTHISKAATEIHKENPNVLVVVSGLNYDTELQFLKKKPLKVNLGNKLVFETHLYAWSGIGTLKLREIWNKQPLNRICAHSIEGIDERAGFLTMGKKAYPLIFTEFGFDQTQGTSDNVHNRFVSCLQTYLVGRDLDWGMWALQGGYYLREDQVSLEETFGILDANFSQLRYPQFADKFQLLQRKNQDPSSKLPYQSIMYHPQSGQCVQVNAKDELELGNCETKNRWVHDGKGGQVLLSGTNKCLHAAGEGKPALVTGDCKSKKSFWKPMSLTKLHLANMGHHGEHLCLQKDSNTTSIVTAKCICITDDSACLDNPQSQWFQLVPTNV
ncbi:hypothetical protein L6164_003838 [Bauhinia variegata]|uniref:Uncharacterized protein n=1 Tax=Bauhinia variegata TaxID=167791 RepID=A0ACB9Q350_BAUVA|nr:hypothetical protein L6164_003838 [Bauhinia variegata]